MMGRKPMIIGCMIICAATAFLSPYSGPDIYPWYFILRIIFGSCMFGILCNPLINDYIKSDSRG